MINIILSSQNIFLKIYDTQKKFYCAFLYLFLCERNYSYFFSFFGVFLYMNTYKI